jgi:hypothetical protein
MNTLFHCIDCRDAVRILAEGAPNTLSYDVILKDLYEVRHSI